MADSEAEEAFASVEIAGSGREAGTASVEMGDSEGEWAVSSVETADEGRQSRWERRDPGF
ncbi:hypothetical protein [Sorangium sp. So ce1024]|uniref:hypothetical protein n=1 Tax=unclassified Sorangium TaxID=2621164 RepID=UPI003EFC1766